MRPGVSFAPTPLVRRNTVGYSRPVGTLTTWMYVSRSCLTVETAPAAVANILAESQAHNAANGITGVLLFTGARFAQLVEGSSGAINRLRAIISADERHDDLVTLSPPSSTGRRFEGWSLAYNGDSGFVATAVERVLAADAGQVEASALLRLMEELVAPGAF
ncbi:BLUF domain-containing protein [Sphingomonas sp. LT1P40]|uniref:BLUF domain-containing protein n=1 Tax=Alteristakelama amylovorans TaxID=3096166 RepID=UPI002FC6AE4E